MKSGYSTAAFSRGHRVAKLLCHPCVLEVPRKGDVLKSGYITSASSYPISGLMCYVTPIFLEVRRKRVRSKAHTPPLPYQEPTIGPNCRVTPALSGVPQNRRPNQHLHHPCLLRHRQVGGAATYPLRSPGCPGKGDKIRSAYITPACSVAHNWAELGRKLAFSGVHGRGGQSKSGYSTLTFSGAHKWADMLHNPCIFFGGGAKKVLNQKRVHHNCLLGGPRA